MILGSYPKTLVTDQNLVNELNALECVDDICEYQGNRYYKLKNKYYLFEPLEWVTVKVNWPKKTEFMTTKDVIDAHSIYHFKEESEKFDLLRHLNIYFLKIAFNEEERKQLKLMNKVSPNGDNQRGYVRLLTNSDYKDYDTMFFDTAFTDFARDVADIHRNLYWLGDYQRGCYGRHYLSVDLDDKNIVYGAYTQYGIRPVIEVESLYETIY